MILSPCHASISWQIWLCWGHLEHDELALDGQACPQAGCQVYLLGFASDSEPFPKPEIAVGMLSGIHQGEALDARYLQVDIESSAGRDGWLVISDDGAFICSLIAFWL